MSALNQLSARIVSLTLVALACSCGKEPEPPKKIHTTYRVLSGASMGATGAAAQGLRHSEKFDAIGALGGPLDYALLLRTIDKFHTGGFCELSALQAIAAEDPAKLNDPAVIASCAKRPPTTTNEHSQDFNNWVFTTNGNFDRDRYSNLFTDLALAYGNLMYENPASPFAPPGVDPHRLRQPPLDFCTNPVRVKGLYNAEYNPTGSYDAITFCDGQPKLYYCRSTLERVDFCADPNNLKNPLPPTAERAFAEAQCQGKGGADIATNEGQPLFMLQHAGKVDPCRAPTKPLAVVLAIDINGNGRRDYGEPIFSNGYERFDDVGADGCPDAQEDGNGGCSASGATGDPNGDNFEPFANPLGTENDWVWQPGEPFRDDGLDGVPGTGDVGEGNGAYDVTSGRKRLLEHDPRTSLKQMTDAQRERFSLLVDGGFRDPFNFGLASKLLFGLLKSMRSTPVGEYRDYAEIPGMLDPRKNGYNPWNNKWGEVPNDLFVLYGKAQPTDQDRIDGEGDHVGTVRQALDRFDTLFNWSAARWPSLEKPKTPAVGSSLRERQKVTWYDSALLRGKREYGIQLPPGYDLPENAETRYPVLYMMPGYGTAVATFLQIGLIPDTYMTDTSVKLRPMIIVFPSGGCCFNHPASGARDCRESDDAGNLYINQLDWVRECNSGTFFVNRQGYVSGDEVPYGDALFELIDHVDQTYRTLPAEDRETR